MHGCVKCTKGKELLQILFCRTICFFSNFHIHFTGMKKELSILIACAAIWCAGIVLAPLLSPAVVSDILYRFYATVCHQFTSRSFHLHDAPFAVCIRCTAIYFGFLLALFLFRLLPTLRKKEFSAPAVLIVSAIPIALDGLTSFAHFYEPSVVSRVITGSIFGIGMAFLLHKTLSELIHSSLQKLTARYEPKTR